MMNTMCPFTKDGQCCEECNFYVNNHRLYNCKLSKLCDELATYLSDIQKNLQDIHDNIT